MNTSLTEINSWQSYFHPENTNKSGLTDVISERYSYIFNGHYKHVAILGASSHASSLISGLKELNISIIGVFDNDNLQLGKNFYNYTIESQDDLVRIPREIPVIIASHVVLPAYLMAKSLGFQNIIPFNLFSILRPNYFPTHPFYEDLCNDVREHYSQYKDARNLFHDCESKKYFDALLNYRYSLDLSIFETWKIIKKYPQVEFFNYKNKSVIVDGGSYKGNPVEKILQNLENETSLILAFEPSKQIFKLLSQRFSNSLQVRTYNACLGRKTCKVSFLDNGTTQATIAEPVNGQSLETVDMFALDDLPEAKKANLIQLNIEGSELEAIKGAEKIIRENHPILMIDIYHRASHLHEIPLKIKELWSDYRLYLRNCYPVPCVGHTIVALPN